VPPSDDPRAALAQLVVRLRTAPAPARPAVVAELLPLLANARVPPAVRLAAAGRALDALPDTAQAARAVARALTEGLPPARGLHRLRHLQHLTEQGTALDALVAARERKVKMACPRCGTRLARAEMAKHLWHTHGLELVRGKTRTRAQAVGAIRRAYAASGDPALFDRAAGVGGEPAVGVWAAETASAEEAAPVCAAARTRGASVCPGCFADVPPAVPGLPPPLAVANGRLAGDGHVAAAPGALPPRAAAALAAAGVLVAVTAVAHVALGFVLAIVAYVLVLAVRVARAPADDRAVDAAWRKLAPRLADRRDAARFLTRLCVTSVGRGDPLERANALVRVIARARDAPAERQLLAAGLALQMDDAGRFGRDHVAGVADLVALALRGEQPPDFAEYALATYSAVPRDPGARARLRVLVYAAAFEAGLGPRDVLALSRAAEHFGGLGPGSPHDLALLFGVWAHRAERPWATVGAAQTVFELAAGSPATAAKLLATDPHLLLVADSHPDVRGELGPVLVTTAGVSVGGVSSADPGAEVRLGADGRELIFGRRALRLGRALPAGFAAELKAWLRFRAEVLAAYPGRYLRAEPGPVSQLLSPFVARCTTCGTACVPVVGAIADRVRV
jgi:predicted RNA-binding Zn-ribbon protein involved in translation (DUF1610 family)